MNKRTDRKIRSVYEAFPLNENFASFEEDSAVERPSHPICDDAEREFADFFEYLRAASGAENGSLDDLLDAAIDQEEKFAAWRKSGLSLKNVQLFHRTGGERRLIKKTRRLPFFGRFFKTSVHVDLEDVDENSRFEIWECDRLRRPAFPLLRIFFSKIRRQGELFACERLREDYALKVRAEETGEAVSFDVSLFDPLEKTSLAVRLENYIANCEYLWRRVFERYKPCFASLILLVSISSTLFTSIACSNNQRVLAGVKTEQNLIGRSFEERLGDEKLSMVTAAAQKTNAKQTGRTE